MYLYLGQPDEWAIEQEIKVYMPLSNVPKIIRPDAQFKRDGKWCFLEIDRTQSMAENKSKIERYQELDSGVQKQFGYKPLIIFYTLTERRQKALKTMCENAGLICEIYNKEDLR